jgi:hypothetical protein
MIHSLDKRRPSMDIRRPASLYCRFIHPPGVFFEGALMKSLSRPLMSGLAAAVFCLTLTTTATHAADPAPAKDKAISTASKPRKAGAADPNVKAVSLKNSKADKDKALAPAKKAGKSRGNGPEPCLVNIDNRTPWKVQIFIDGRLRGFVDSFGDGTVVTGEGKTRLYGVAEFVDADDLVYGPEVFDCSGEVTWKINP